MSLKPETVNKLRKLAVPLFFILAAAFMIYAFFLNRAHLAISGPAPFSVTIKNLRSENCAASPCHITLAPASYDLEIDKIDYFPVTAHVDLKLWQTLELKPDLQQRPYLQPLGNWDSVIPQELIPQPTDYTIKDAAPNLQPALFKGTDPTPLIYFTRKINKFKLFPSPDEKYVAMLDFLDDNTSSLYLLDLAAKTRTLIQSENSIVELKWLSDSQRFLIQKVNLTTLNREIYLGAVGNPDLQPLAFSETTFDLVAEQNTDSILYASPLADSDTGFTIQKLNLKTADVQTLYSSSDLAMPSRILYSQSAKKLWLETQGTAYSLSPLS